MGDLSEFIGIDISNYSELLNINSANISEVLGYGNTPPVSYDAMLIFTGYNGTAVIADMEHISFSTPTQTGMYFGDVVLPRLIVGAASNGSNSRAVASGGSVGANYYDNIEYATINSPGNAAVFDVLSVARGYAASYSNATNERGITAGGTNASVSLNTIDFITINSIGESIDFGDLTYLRRGLAGLSNGTNERGINAAGSNWGVAHTNIIDYITINNAPSNAVDFGDTTANRVNLSGFSNGTSERGILAGGNFQSDTSAFLNIIEYITINSPGNSVDFGDLSVAKASSAQASNNTIGIIFAGRTGSSAFTSDVEYITIGTTGNAADYGEALATYGYSSGTSAY